MPSTGHNTPAGAPDGFELLGTRTAARDPILAPQALSFVAGLHRRFDARRRELLAARVQRQTELDAGRTPDFLPGSRSLREGDWRVRPAPPDLLDRRVEITGPVDRKMIINALNAPVRTFMADFEDSCSPTWSNIADGQVNLRDAVRGTIHWSQGGREYRLNERTATLIVRPRGWHLPERHFRVDGEAVAGGLFDFGLFLWHNAVALLAKGSGPYFYLPKLESHLEARLWSDVIRTAEDELGLARGTVRVTVLIETLPAAFEMDEILYELRDHIVGLNCGRWDYIFSFIKKLGANPRCLFPDRSEVTMDRHFLRSYVDLLIRTCHRRGAHAMGGMAAQIPIRGDVAANERAIEKVRQDKLREARAGHDGTWIAHPGLADVARDAFDSVMKGPNQLEVARADVHVTAADLLEIPAGRVTEEGVRHNVRVGTQYLAAWLGGNGCVPLCHLMEDAATAEISRAQLWQWLRHGVALDGGPRLTVELFDRLRAEEMDRLVAGLADDDRARLVVADRLLGDMVRRERLDEFLTLPAYEYLNGEHGA